MLSRKPGFFSEKEPTCSRSWDLVFHGHVDVLFPRRMHPVVVGSLLLIILRVFATVLIVFYPTPFIFCTDRFVLIFRRVLDICGTILLILLMSIWAIPFHHATHKVLLLIFLIASTGLITRTSGANLIRKIEQIFFHELECQNDPAY
jgi:hypothetical protein